jgi:hypothetical protein
MAWSGKSGELASVLGHKGSIDAFPQLAQHQYNAQQKGSDSTLKIT